MTAIDPLLRDRLEGLRAAMTAPLPTDAEITAWNEADRAMAERVRRVMPGVPLHHAFATLQTLRIIQRQEQIMAGPTELDRLAFLRSAVDLIRRADISSEQIWLYLKDQQPAIAVDVSDVFGWGGSDAEDVTPEHLPVLEQAWRDCKAVDADEWTVELYAARVRGMRPQGAAYPTEAAIAALFDACGPERPTGLGNPRKPPATTPKET